MMKTEYKWSLANVGVTFGILTAVWAFMVWAGIDPITRDDFNDFKKEMRVEHAAHTVRDDETDKHLARDEMAELEALGRPLSVEEHEHYCEAARVLSIRPEFC